MKKIFTMLCLAGVMVNASAQDTKLYGVMNVGVRHETNNTAAGESATKVVSGNTFTSRFGITSEEDLGNGTKIKLRLESGLAPTSGVSGNTGSTGTVLFDRAAWVGIANAKFGEVQVGRNTLATNDFALSGVGDLVTNKGETGGQPANTANSTYAVAPLRAAQIATFVGSTGGKNNRSDSLIKYVNQFGPVAVRLGYAPGGQNGTDNRTSYTGSLVYAQGPVTMGAANFTASDAAGKELSVNGVGAKYDVGAFTFQAAKWTQKSDAGYVAANLTTNGTYTGPVMGTATNTGPSTNSSVNTAGVSYRVNPKLTTTVSMYRGEYANGAGKIGKLNSEVFLTEYAVSKRTNFYGIVDRAAAQGDIASSTVTKAIVGYTVGINHRF
jgi:predicted porin